MHFRGLIVSIVVSFAVLCIIDRKVDGHNYLSFPVSRGNQRQSETGCRFGGEGSPTCGGPCELPAGSGPAPISVQRGSIIELTWYRHTHPGGFVRFAWAPTALSDTHANFDSGVVDRYVCKEIGGCGPLYGGEADASTNGIDCGINLTVPLSLSSGAWTIQWAYFGGWLNAGDYYACVDYTITGGPTGPQMTAEFYGGDVTYPNSQQCLFYSTSALHVCTVEPCENGTYAIGVAQAGAASVYSSGKFTPVPIGISTVVSNSGSTNSNQNIPIPCTSNSSCPHGVCDITGFCTATKAIGGLGAGGIAAIVFAMLIVVVAGVAALFFVLNKSEIPFMRPFKSIPA